MRPNSYLYGLYNHPRLRVIAPAAMAAFCTQLPSKKQLTAISPPARQCVNRRPLQYIHPTPTYRKWGGRQHRHSFVDCLQVGAESRGPSCRPAELVFPAPRPAATGHSAAADPLAAGCFPDLPPPKRVHPRSGNPEKTNPWEGCRCPAGS